MLCFDIKFGDDFIGLTGLQKQKQQKPRSCCFGDLVFTRSLFLPWSEPPPLIRTTAVDFCLVQSFKNYHVTQKSMYTRSAQKVSSLVIWKIETFIEEDTRNTHTGQGLLSPLQSRHLGTSHSSPSHHQLPCCICLNLIDSLKSLPFQRWF